MFHSATGPGAREPLLADAIDAVGCRKVIASAHCPNADPVFCMRANRMLSAAWSAAMGQYQLPDAALRAELSTAFTSHVARCTILHAGRAAATADALTVATVVAPLLPARYVLPPMVSMEWQAVMPTHRSSTTWSRCMQQRSQQWR